MRSVVIINLFWIPLGSSCFHSDISQIGPDLLYYCGYICLQVLVDFPRVSSALLPASASHGSAVSPPCHSAFIPVCLVLFESALYTSEVKQGGGWGRTFKEGLGWGGVALTRSVKTHPSLSLLCPCSVPPVSWLPPPSLFLLLPAVTQCSLPLTGTGTGPYHHYPHCLFLYYLPDLKKIKNKKWHHLKKKGNLRRCDIPQTSSTFPHHLLMLWMIFWGVGVLWWQIT